VHGLHKGTHVLRAHVWVEAVAQVGDVALGPESLQHLLHQFANLLLSARWETMCQPHPAQGIPPPPVPSQPGRLLGHEPPLQVGKLRQEDCNTGRNQPPLLAMATAHLGCIERTGIQVPLQSDIFPCLCTAAGRKQVRCCTWCSPVPAAPTAGHTGPLSAALGCCELHVAWGPNYPHLWSRNLQAWDDPGQRQRSGYLASGAAQAPGALPHSYRASWGRMVQSRPTTS